MAAESPKKQTQYKPNQSQSKPIKANKMPKQTQYKPNFKRYLAKMGHHELKYIDRLGQLTLNLIQSSDSALNSDEAKK